MHLHAKDIQDWNPEHSSLIYLHYQFISILENSTQILFSSELSTASHSKRVAVTPLSILNLDLSRYFSGERIRYFWVYDNNIILPKVSNQM
jgi:hypothetical protein